MDVVAFYPSLNTEVTENVRYFIWPTLPVVGNIDALVLHCIYFKFLRFAYMLIP